MPHIRLLVPKMDDKPSDAHSARVPPRYAPQLDSEGSPHKVRPPGKSAVPDPIRLEYRRTDEVQATTGRFAPGALFSFGFFGGIALSVIVWIFGAQTGARTDSVFWLGVVVAVKAVGGATLRAIRKLRPLGLGLLCSFLVGCLIFGYGALAMCAVSWSGGH